MQFISASIAAGVFPVSVLLHGDDGGNHRRCVTPDRDISDLPQDVQASIKTHWSGMDTSGWERIKNPPDPAPTAADVAAEARRRVDRIAYADERADMALEWNALLTRQAAGTLTDAGKARAVELKSIWQGIAAIKAAGRALAAMNPIPADYASKARWPG